MFKKTALLFCVPFLFLVFGAATQIEESDLNALKVQALLLKPEESAIRLIRVNQKNLSVTLARQRNDRLIIGILDQNDGEPCFELLVYSKNADDNRYDASITAVRSCQEAYGLSGNDFFALGEALIQKLGLRWVTLIDNSRIACHKGSSFTEIEKRLSIETDPRKKRSMRIRLLYLGSRDASLAAVRMFTRGNTWYGSKGFYPKYFEQETFNAFNETLRNVSFKRYLECLNDFTSTSWLYRTPSGSGASPKGQDFGNEALKWVQKYKIEFPQDDLILLKDFMGWMFRQKCESFDLALEELKTVPACKNYDIGSGIRQFMDLVGAPVKSYDASSSSPLGSRSPSHSSDERILRYIYMTPYR